jgi:hypothetical protein
VNIAKADTRRLGHASTASAVGAALIGTSIGILFHDELLRFFIAIFVLGLGLHAVGMYDWHRIERRGATKPTKWMRALYAVCWVGLAALAAYVVVRAATR